MTRHRYPSLHHVLVITAVLALMACSGGATDPASGKPLPGTDAAIQEPGAPEITPGLEQEADAAVVEAPTRLPSNAIPIHLFGRSVTYNWFSYWRWEGDDMAPVVKGRYVLYHHSIDSPENMFNSVRDIVETLPADSRIVIWWKFCFDDFSGAEEAQSNIQRNEQIVRQMYQYIVEQKKYRLIIGNALPKVAQDVDADLVKAQRQYNQWLNDFQKGHTGKMFVLDLYSVLADPNGAERVSFASAPDDSHPNAAGYQALDAMFLPFLERNIK